MTTPRDQALRSIERIEEEVQHVAALIRASRTHESYAEEIDRLRTALKAEEGRAGRMQDVLRWAYGLMSSRGRGTVGITDATDASILRQKAEAAGANITTDAKPPQTLEERAAEIGQRPNTLQATPIVKESRLLGITETHLAFIRQTLTARSACLHCRSGVPAHRMELSLAWPWLHDPAIERDQWGRVCSDPAVQDAVAVLTLKPQGPGR